MLSNPKASKNQYIIDPKTPIMPKEFSEGFSLLTEDEMKYAFNFNRAGWAGALICLHQVSYESPILFCLSQFLFNGQDVKDLKARALAAGSTDELFVKYMAYWGGFYGNYGNYLSFGNTKIIPDLEPEEFLKIVKSAPHFDSFAEAFGETFETVWGWIDKETFAYQAPYNAINLPSKGGVSGYMSRDMTEEELDMITRFLKSKSISPLNTRVFKKRADEKPLYEITIASVDKKEESFEFEGQAVMIKWGEFSEYLAKVNKFLGLAQESGRSELQKDMITDYINHFKNGDIDLHIESQIKWVNDKSPVIETNIGFIETYLDPQNIRAYFETLVAIVNKNRSQKYTTLVNNSQGILAKMPWDKEYLKDKFQEPDFTSLDVITFASTGCPLGINIPNYDKVRNDIGFKNVYLANNADNYQANTLKFLSPEDIDLIVKNGNKGFTLHVALHELLGHGSGKLFFADEKGTLNFDKEAAKNMLTGEKVDSWYKHGDTWNQKFGKISSSYEECRADVCGLYLGFEPLAYQIFDITADDINDNMCANMLNHMRKAVLGLKLFDAENKKWGQAHTQGAFVYLRFIMDQQDQNNKIVDFVVNEKGNDFKFVLNRSLYVTEGRRITGQLLQILQQYKSTADVEGAVQFYQKYSEVNECFLKIRKIVLANLSPRNLDLYHDFAVSSEGKISIVKFESTFEGLLNSVSSHYEEPRDQLIQMVLREWRVNSHLLRV